MIDLKTAKVIITGGSAGIGLEMAKALMLRGSEVTVIARDSIKLGAARDAGWVWLLFGDNRANASR